MVDKSDLIIARIDDMKEAHSNRLDSIDRNLLAHMKRTEMLEARVDALEEPVKARKYLKGWMIGLGALLGVILTILKFLGYFGV